ncbi:hypothetical protein HMPREF1548_06196 [Clostridium sp. KLE 1755]|nr:hypothetical protein HMPREF1548_06196 [Clostridium sp. KLE 1755]
MHSWNAALLPATVIKYRSASSGSQYFPARPDVIERYTALSELLHVIHFITWSRLQYK